MSTVRPYRGGVAASTIQFMGDWHTIWPAAELRPGQVVEVSWEGEDLLLYRLASGQCRVITGYCPHMNNYIPNALPEGAELSKLLEGDQISCPWHGWLFDGEGRCTHVPTGQRVPAVVAKGWRIARCWQVREQGAHIQIGPELKRGATTAPDSAAR